MVCLDLLLCRPFSRQPRFKLDLRSRVGAGKRLPDEIPPLPPNKTVVEVLADFLAYLLACASSYIRETHANGADLWASVNNQIDFVLSHPNGWEGAQQAQMRQAAVLAKLIPDTTAGHARLSFVTEGEASLHFAVQQGLPVGVMEDGEGVVIVDAGGGTIDISSYSKNVEAGTTRFAEVAAPQCNRCHLNLYFSNLIVTHRPFSWLDLRNFECSTIPGEYVLHSVKFHGTQCCLDHLLESHFFADIDRIAGCFDKTTKLRFRNSGEPQYIQFGGARDNDPSCNIRFGQLKLLGSDVAEFFEPSVECIVNAVLEQCRVAHKPISVRRFFLGDPLA